MQPAVEALILKQPGSFLGDLLAQGLLAAGMHVVTVATPYDIVVEAERSTVSPRCVLLAVDYFGREEFRLLPLLKREWPDTQVATYHSSGFEHKGRLAELMGADFVLGEPEDVAALLETLARKPATSTVRPAVAWRPSPLERPPSVRRVAPPPAPVPVAPPEPAVEPEAAPSEAETFAANLDAALAQPAAAAPIHDTPPSVPNQTLPSPATATALTRSSPSPSATVTWRQRWPS